MPPRRDGFEHNEERLLRLFIADDSDLLRQRPGAMLAQLQGIEIVGEARDALEATKLILNLKPDKEG